MKLNKTQFTHLVPFLLFFVLSSIYFAPLYSGKTLAQSDNILLAGTGSEIRKYQEKGEHIRWTNAEFSGLPVPSGSYYNPFTWLNVLLYSTVVPKVLMMMLTLFAGFYVLAYVLGLSRWLAFLGGLVYSFGSFNILSIEAGHDNKVLAVAFMAPILAGVVDVFKENRLRGSLILFISAGFQLYYGHVQITYYTLLVVLGYLILVIVHTARAKTWPTFFQSGALIAIVTLLAFGCNFGRMYALLEYSEYSTRGGTELSVNDQPREGLDKEYAQAWSNGVMETFTIAFPYFHGGATREELSTSSETYDALTSRGVDRQTIRNFMENVPLYWGTQPFTGGPVYFGVILCFLFVLGLFILDHPIKWWGLGVTLLSLLLAMGKNLEWFTDLFFYYAPYYNKFRSVTMIMSVAQLSVPIVGLLALHKVIQKGDRGMEKQLIRAAGVIIGLGLFFIVFKNSLFDFTSPADARTQYPDWLMSAIEEDRISKFSSDIWKGIILVGLAALGLWLVLRGQLKANYLLIGLGALMFFDMWIVDKRYLNEDDFQNPRKLSMEITKPTAVDLQIMQDTTYYRVFNTTRRLDQDGLTSYHHMSVGGYNAIKMQRYQELLDHHVMKGNRDVLNMLNTKYIIVDDESGKLRFQRNPEALGNVWAVEQITIVENADEELESLNRIDPENEAVVDDRFAGYFDGKPRQYSGAADVRLENYHPEEMTYSFSSDDEQFLVFSEIYYDPGWNVYIDGEEVDHVRVNYVLRGVYVSAGNHQIVFRYEPKSVEVGNAFAVISPLIFLVGFIGMVLLRKKNQE